MGYNVCPCSLVNMKRTCHSPWLHSCTLGPANAEPTGPFLGFPFSGNRPRAIQKYRLKPKALPRRFGFGAAILFSDFLIVPLALGRKVELLAGEGPKLGPLVDVAGLTALRNSLDETALTVSQHLGAAVFCPAFDRPREARVDAREAIV